MLISKNNYNQQNDSNRPSLTYHLISPNSDLPWSKCKSANCEIQNSWKIGKMDDGLTPEEREMNRVMRHVGNSNSRVKKNSKWNEIVLVFWKQNQKNQFSLYWLHEKRKSWIFGLYFIVYSYWFVVDLICKKKKKKKK